MYYLFIKLSHTEEKIIDVFYYNVSRDITLACLHIGININRVKRLNISSITGQIPHIVRQRNYTWYIGGADYYYHVKSIQIGLYGNIVTVIRVTTDDTETICKDIFHYSHEFNGKLKPINIPQKIKFEKKYFDIIIKN